MSNQDDVKQAIASYEQILKEHEDRLVSDLSKRNDLTTHEKLQEFKNEPRRKHLHEVLAKLKFETQDIVEPSGDDFKYFKG